MIWLTMGFLRGKNCIYYSKIDEIDSMEIIPTIIARKFSKSISIIYSYLLPLNLYYANTESETEVSSASVSLRPFSFLIS